MTPDRVIWYNVLNSKILIGCYDWFWFFFFFQDFSQKVTDQSIRTAPQFRYLSHFITIISLHLLILIYPISHLIFRWFCIYAFAINWMHKNHNKVVRSGDSSEVFVFTFYWFWISKCFFSTKPFDDDLFSHVAYSSFLGEGQSTFSSLSLSAYELIFQK